VPAGWQPGAPIVVCLGWVAVMALPAADPGQP
jgi:hypothetical protein